MLTELNGQKLRDGDETFRIVFSARGQANNSNSARLKSEVAVCRLGRLPIEGVVSRPKG